MLVALASFAFAGAAVLGIVSGGEAASARAGTMAVAAPGAVEAGVAGEAGGGRM